MCTSCVSLLALVLFGGSAGASAKAPEPISGKLSQPGYTVIALADGGLADTDLATNGAFELNPPASEVTLHLRAPDGTYAGPIVLQQKGNPVKRAKKSLGKAKRTLKKAKLQAKAKKALKRARRRLKKARAALKRARRLASGRRAILGVKDKAGLSSVRLGNVTVDSAAGYATAKLTTRQWKQWTDQKRVATAVHGVPIGAGNVGRVAVTKLNGPGDDPDRDGVPNPLDIDDDGDLVLDSFDPANSGSASATASQANGITVVAGRSFLSLDLPHTVNASAGSTSAQINEALRSRGELLIAHAGLDYADSLPNLPGALPELDCAADPQAVPPRPGLSYCSAGGTGRLDPTPYSAGPPDAGEPFPACCDPDGNGFGSLILDTTLSGPFPVYARWLDHGATSAQIHTGDVLITHLRTSGGGEREFAGVVVFVFATVPTLVSYSDEAGNSGSISYPVAPRGLGTDSNRLPVADGPDPDSDVEVTLNFWRPQRPAAPGEPGEWTDVGNLIYSARAKAFGSGPEYCPSDAYTEISPDLTPLAKVPVLPGSGLRDTIGDRVPQPGNTFSFKLNLTECTHINGGSFDNPGDGTVASLSAVPDNGIFLGRGDEAQASEIAFTRK